jgi:H+/Cl- antiporter ClcA
MAENRDFELVKHFMGHLITGGVLFLTVGAVSALLELSADWLDEHPKLWLLAIVFHLVAYLILVLDVGCLIFFLVIRAYRFVRDTWALKDG